MTRSVRLAVVHFGKDHLDLAANADRLVRRAREAAERGAQLIVLPELPIVPSSRGEGPLLSSRHPADLERTRRNARELAAGALPALIERLRVEVAAIHGAVLVTSTLRGGSALVASAVVIAANGVSYPHDKRFLTGDAAYLLAGDGPLEPVDLPFGRVGVLLCADYSLPLLARALVLNGAEMIVVPAALLGSTAPTLRVRALENGVPLALANCFTTGEGVGESAIVGPSVAEITSALNDMELTADLPLAPPCLVDRQPGRYQGALMDLTARPLGLRPPVAHLSGSSVLVTTEPVGLGGFVAHRTEGGASLVGPEGDVVLERRADGPIETWVDLAPIRVGLLRADDLLHPEIVETHRNAGVDLLLIPSPLPVEAFDLYRDVAQARHINLAVGGAGVYQRWADGVERVTDGDATATLDLTAGRAGPARISRAGLEVILRPDGH